MTHNDHVRSDHAAARMAARTRVRADVAEPHREGADAVQSETRGQLWTHAELYRPAAPVGSARPLAKDRPFTAKQHAL
ncbi:unnamed protein product [Lota lota]